MSHFEYGVPAGLVQPDNNVLSLEESGDISGMFMLDDRLLLGYDIIWKSYHPEFVAAGYKRSSSSFPMAIWDAKTGEKLLTLKGFHTGSPRGAKKLDENRLITWARDFRVFLWDMETGEPLAAFTSPVHLDEKGYAIVSSRNGEDYSADDWVAYMEGRGAPGFNVTHYMQPVPAGEQLKYGPFEGHEGKGTTIRRYELDIAKHIDHRDLLLRLQDLEGAEAGYSTPFRMEDGRFGIGGATYGTWEQVFVWDGVKDLIILFPKRLYVDCEIVGEIAPNTVRIDEGSEIYVFKDI
ncbi:MAG: hypothetical protein MI743_04415 [Sneathiellales bacterium]|nr:hypothetical protein [Sneathiellales bacterium]